jgi:hypothetical protein
VLKCVYIRYLQNGQACFLRLTRLGLPSFGGTNFVLINATAVVFFFDIICRAGQSVISTGRSATTASAGTLLSLDFQWRVVLILGGSGPDSCLECRRNDRLRDKGVDCHKR